MTPSMLKGDGQHPGRNTKEYFIRGATLADFYTSPLTGNLTYVGLCYVTEL